MKGDFSRDTFDVTKHFSRVLQQQGRVQLDADWNEQTSIMLHYLRTLLTDLIGPFAAPANDGGFLISDLKQNENNEWTFSIGKGRFYVDGILCENEECIDYLLQSNFPNPMNKLGNPADKPCYLVYLDVWERHITSLEDDTIREKALGGPDTASRQQIIWQVKVMNSHCYDNSLLESYQFWSSVTNDFLSSIPGSLSARVKPVPASNASCLTAPDAKFRGHENQLYRVEIHKGGVVNEATFKWSRENGSIVTACELIGSELILQNSRGFDANQWVELTCEELELRGQPGTLVKAIKVEGNVLTLQSKPDEPLNLQKQDKKWPTKVRRWDHHETKGIELNDGSINLLEMSPESSSGQDVWIDLEDGIQIQFQQLPRECNQIYQSGDYWLIPARVATGNIEWPNKVLNGNPTPISKPPDGIHHHYAPLAFLRKKASVDNLWDVIDLRPLFNHVSYNPMVIP
jgi:hypothetical protein